MAITAVTPEVWDEFCSIGITEEGGSEKQFWALTEDITAMDWGEKDIEGIPLVNGGRVVKRTPLSDESITMKIWPVTAQNSATSMIQLMHPQGAYGAIADDVAQPIVVDNTNNRRKHKLVFLWTTKHPAAASSPPDATNPAYRVQIINAYMTKNTPSFDDKMKSAEVMFKWAPFNKAATNNKREESCDSTTQLATATTLVTSWA